MQYIMMPKYPWQMLDCICQSGIQELVLFLHNLYTFYMSTCLNLRCNVFKTEKYFVVCID